LSITAGLHVPVILFSDVLGNSGTFPPAQIFSVVPKLKVGIIFGVTVTLNIASVAHCPDVGVKI
jgi:hypothetical protein